MRRHRLTITTVALLSLACSAVAPTAAVAGGSLLSGYGGPGDGSQAILGSTLLNGPRPGGGASADGRASSGGGGGTAGAGGGAAPAAAGRARGPAQPPGAAAQLKRQRASRAHASPGSAGRGRLTSVASAPRVAVGSQPLGLSSVDMAYILLALTGVVLTGVFTTKLARRAT